MELDNFKEEFKDKKYNYSIEIVINKNNIYNVLLLIEKTPITNVFMFSIDNPNKFDKLDFTKFIEYKLKNIDVSKTTIKKIVNIIISGVIQLKLTYNKNKIKELLNKIKSINKDINLYENKDVHKLFNNDLNYWNDIFIENKNYKASNILKCVDKEYYNELYNKFVKDKLHNLNYEKQNNIKQLKELGYKYKIRFNNIKIVKSV